MGLMDLLAPQTPAPAAPPAAVPMNQPGGLLDLILGRQNPFAQFADQHRNVLGAIGAGLGKGPDFASGLSAAAQLVPAAASLDRDAQQQFLQRNQTYQLLKKDPRFSYLADAVENGGLSLPDAYSLMAKTQTTDAQKAADLAKSQAFAKTLANDPNAANYGDIIGALNSGAIGTADAFKAVTAAKTAGTKPPTVVENYDATGQPQKMTWDATSGSWKPFGGPKAGTGDPAEDDKVQAIADAISSGKQPPVLTGLYHLAGPVRAALAKSGYNLTSATQDFSATQRLLSTMNGPQQVKLRQATQQVAEQVSMVRGLADQWKAGGLKPLNSATRKLAESGVLGQKAQSIVTKLDSAIADMTAELGTVYMGGNSPTDHSLELAGQNLSSDWSDTTLQDNLDQLERNLGIRLNSLNLSTAGVPDSQYNRMPPGGVGSPAFAPVPRAAAGQAQPGEQTATNPQTGQKLVLRNGQWMPL